MDKHGLRPDPDAAKAALTRKNPQNRHTADALLKIHKILSRVLKGYADKVYPMRQLMRNEGKKFERMEKAQEALENIKRELCEAPVLVMPTEKG